MVEKVNEASTASLSSRTFWTWPIAPGTALFSMSLMAPVQNGPPPLVAVGTALAGGPPHRSQRAEFPHWAPASGSSGKACLRVGMQDSGRWEPSGRQAVHPLPVQAVALTAAPERLQPVPGDLSPER